MRFKCLHGLAPEHLMFTLSIPYTETSWIYRDSKQLPVGGHLCIEGRYFIYDYYYVPKHTYHILLYIINIIPIHHQTPRYTAIHHNTPYT